MKDLYHNLPLTAVRAKDPGTLQALKVVREKVVFHTLLAQRVIPVMAVVHNLQEQKEDRVMVFDRKPQALMEVLVKAVVRTLVLIDPSDSLERRLTSVCGRNRIVHPWCVAVGIHDHTRGEDLIYFDQLSRRPLLPLQREKHPVHSHFPFQVLPLSASSGLLYHNPLVDILLYLAL